MNSLLSAIAIITIVGHLVSIFRARAYWPFDYYPMYSLPFNKLIYPIVQGDHLTVFCLMDTTDSTKPVDLMSGPDVFPKCFHPLDRLNISYLMLAGLNLNGEQFQNKQRMEDAGRTVISANASTRISLDEILKGFIELAAENGTAVKKMSVIQLEWTNFRDPKSHYKKPDAIKIIGEYVAGINQ